MSTLYGADYNRVGAANTLDRARAAAPSQGHWIIPGKQQNDAISQGAKSGLRKQGLGAAAPFRATIPFREPQMIATQGLSTYNGLHVRITGRAGRLGPVRSLRGESRTLCRGSSNSNDQAFAGRYDNDCVPASSPGASSPHQRPFIRWLISLG